MPPILKIRTELAVPLNADDLAAAGALPQQIQDYLASTPGVVVTKWSVDMVAPRKAPESCLEPSKPKTCPGCGATEGSHHEEDCPQLEADLRQVRERAAKALNEHGVDIPPALDRRPGKEVD